MKIKSEARPACQIYSKSFESGRNFNHETNTNFLNLKSQISIRRGGLLFVFCYLLFVGSCRERVVPPDDKPPYVPPIVLTAEDIGVTDAFIRLKFLDTSNVQAKTFILTRDGKPQMTNTLITNDTLLLDEGLLPNRTYKYRAYRLVNGTPSAYGGDSSAPLLLTTMDTTSHNFKWKIDTLGDGASSVLRDVAIINDTCVWAVGEIYKRDSTGQFETTPYGAAKWNGKSWRLHRLLAPGPTPGSYNSILRPTGVFAFSENNIWFANGGVFKWDSKSEFVTSYWINPFPGNPNPILDPGQTAEKLWGTSSNNLYAVGRAGAIAHFNGSSWRRLELPRGQVGTDLDIYDIYGDKNLKTSEYEIFAVASKIYVGPERKILQIKNNKVSIINDNGIYSQLRSIWFIPGKFYITVGDGFFYKKSIFSLSPWSNDFEDATIYYTHSVRGNNINDIFVAGAYGEILHYNGLSWKSYINETGIDGSYYSIAVNNNLVIAVGRGYQRAVVAIGKR